MREGPTVAFLHEWRGLARALDLDFDPKVPICTGLRDGVQIAVLPRWFHNAVTENWPAVTTLTDVSVSARVRSFSLPGLVIRRQRLFETLGQFFGATDNDILTRDSTVDRRLYIRAADSGATALTLQTEPLLTDLRRCSGANAVYMAGGEVQLIVRDTELIQLREWVDAAVSLASSLQTAVNPTMGSVAEYSGIPVTQGSIDGVVDGVQVSITPDSEAGYRVEVALQLPLAARVHKKDDRCVFSTGDPILDATVCIEGISPATALKLLGQDEIRESLLSVVHGADGRIERGKMIIEAPHREAELLRLLDDAMSVAFALQPKLE